MQMVELPSAFKRMTAVILGGFMAFGPGFVPQTMAQTKTPIQHVVVIFQENVSFDHYFASYPKAKNPAGEPAFHAMPGTPSVNGLTPELLNNNQNSHRPFRLDRSQNVTCDEDHGYTTEQQAFDAGVMDKFVQFVGVGSAPCDFGFGKALTMGYYDGNTVTALWNYAQHYAMSDNSYSTQFGPSSPGAINLISGQANGFSATVNVLDASGNLLHPTHEAFGDASHSPSNITMIGDADPLADVCSNPTIDQVTMAGPNIGDLLNRRNITWGWFEGGFNLQTVNANGS